ncbi:MAG: sortase [Patescibacteria group bacterium]|nr:sortase [Patescibacteria group bacterium]
MHKYSLNEIVAKVDRRIERARKSEVFRIDFPPPGENFDINHVLAYELCPDPAIAITNQMTNFIKIIAKSLILFLLFFLLFNAPAYYQIIANNVLQAANLARESILVEHIEKEVPPEQELIVMTKDPVEQKQQFPELDLAIIPPDNRLIIPSINKNIPIVEVSTESLASQNWTSLDEEILEALKDGAVRYPGTALPGEEGNTFITGHSSYYFWDSGNYNEVFALLSEMEVGDYAIIYYNQQKFTYQITEMREVAPSEVDVLAQPKGKHQLTIMTCTPVGTNLRRLVVIGEMVE